VILVDTSAWIEFLRATQSPAHRRIADLIATDGPLAVTEPVMMEVFAGARDERAQDTLRRLMLRFELLRFDSVADFDAAATLYRRCRRSGITPRGLLDCMIAAVALRHGAAVLSHDADFDRLAHAVGLTLDEASLRAP
jgi:predicted nucleic acid-binding protein